jgi:hypothetical protein
MHNRKHLGYTLLVPLLLFGSASCTSLAQLQSGSAEGGNYSLTALYDGTLASRKQAAKSLDIQATNMCASGKYELLSEETVSRFNQFGEGTYSRLTWTIECEPVSEEAASEPKEVPTPR